MKQRLQNCWEFMKCGREPGGMKADKFGLCPVAVDVSFDGINSGVCAGRICWAVAGTFCNGKIQGTFAEKRKSCTACEFYRKVQTEEERAKGRPKFLKLTSEADGNPVFDRMRHRRVEAGKRFVTQGEISDTAFIIERGSCLVIVEKEGIQYPVNHYGRGDADLPEALRRFICRADRRDPKQRYQNADEAMAVLRPLAKQSKHAPQDNLAFEERKVSTIFLAYKEDQQFALNRLMEEFSAKAQTLGVTLKIADFREP